MTVHLLISMISETMSYFWFYCLSRLVYFLPLLFWTVQLSSVVLGLWVIQKTNFHFMYLSMFFWIELISLVVFHPHLAFALHGRALNIKCLSCVRRLNCNQGRTSTDNDGVSSVRARCFLTPRCEQTHRHHRVVAIDHYCQGPLLSGPFALLKAPPIQPKPRGVFIA